MSIKDFIQLVEQADIPNMQVLGQLDDGFANIRYNGMAGVLDQQTNKMILISLKVPDSFHIVTVAGGRETTQYVSGSEIGPATKKALDSIMPRQRPRPPAPLPVQESYESTDQVRSIVQRMMEDARVPQKPRQGPLRPQTGAGKHKDKKKDQKQGKAKHKGKELDEGRFGRNHNPDSYSGRMPRTDRIDRDSSSGQDAQQRMERKMKQQTIDHLLDRHPDLKHSDLESTSLTKLIQMLRDGPLEEIGNEPQTNIAMGGLSRRTDKAGNTTDRYQAGPMDITMTKNAQGQPVHSGGTYQVNKTASINVDVPYKGGQKGITTMVGKADDPEDLDHLMGASASAERKGVDPKAFARFQQGIREGIPYSYGFVPGRKKPNATTRHLRDYPVSDKDVAKPVKKPEKKKPEQGVAEGLGNKKVTIQGLKNWIAKAQAEGYEVEEVMKGEMWRAVNPKTGGLKGTFHTTDTPGRGSLWGSGPDGTPANSGTLVIKQGVAEGSLETDNMVSHIGQVIQGIYPRGGDKNTYMQLVAREMPRIVKANPKLFRRAFGMAYDRFFHIDQDDDFDYTDYSMRQGERGLEEEKQKGVDGKACWKGYKRMGTKKKGGRTVDNCVKMESISEGILSSFGLMEKSPPGFKGTVKAMKKHPELTKGKTKDGKEKNPWALAWHMKNKGYKSHKKADGSNKD